MSRCEDVKSVVGAAAGSGALSRKSAASGHMGTALCTGRKWETGGAWAVYWSAVCLVGEETGVRLGVEVNC